MGTTAQVQGSRGHRRDDHSEGVTLRGSTTQFEARNRSAIRQASRRDHGPMPKDGNVRDRHAAAADNLDGRNRDPCHLRTDAKIDYYNSPDGCAERARSHEEHVRWEAECAAEEAERAAFQPVDFDFAFDRVHTYVSYARSFPLYGRQWRETVRAHMREQAITHLCALFLVADGHFGPVLAARAEQELAYLPAWETVAILADLGA